LITEKGRVDLHGVQKSLGLKTNRENVQSWTAQDGKLHLGKKKANKGTGG